MDIQELPRERAILHFLWEESPKDARQERESLNSGSSLDIASVSIRESPHSPSAFIRNYLRSVSEWPSPFPISAFSYDVELKLRKGNETFERTKTTVSITRDMKMGILDKIAEAIFAVKAYPDQDQIVSLASALISNHLCLREPGSGTGHDRWKMSIKYKLENHSDDSLEEERMALAEESQKRSKNVQLIRQKMELTFSLRRKEIVEMEPMVAEVMEWWPALFTEAKIKEESHRITNKNLIYDFRAGLNQHTPRLFQLYRARRTAFPPEMDQLLGRLDKEDTAPEEEKTNGLTLGILTVLEDDGASPATNVINLAVVVEETIILQDLPDLPTAFAYLFGLIYTLNLQYPKDLRYTFEMIQKIFMGLGTNLSARVSSLKDRLLQ
ncbi:hypothetical protein CRENBAI_021926 [Crenichthys baileyi]|uniref:Uncharacterized protein n=1 Tax=Crenichthys baileyi TaxID=28760 RepID=A0AAV9QRV9_9TELE